MIIDVEEAPSSFKIQQSSGQKRWLEIGREGGREGEAAAFHNAS